MITFVILAMAATGNIPVAVMSTALVMENFKFHFADDCNLQWMALDMGPLPYRAQGGTVNAQPYVRFRTQKKMNIFTNCFSC